MFLDRILSCDPSPTLIASSAAARAQWEAFLAEREHGPERIAWVPRPVTSWPRWLADCWAHAQEVAVANTDALLLTGDQTEHLWQHVIDASALGATFVDSRRLASWARLARRNLLDSGESLGRGPGGFAAPAAASFLDWNRDFEAALARRGWIDPDSLLYRLNRLPVAGLGHDVVLLDPAWSWPEETRLGARWQAAGFTFASVSPDDYRASVHAVSLPNTVDEAVAVADWAAGQLDAGEPSRIAVVFPDLEDRRHEIETVFADRLGGDAVSTSVGRAVTEFGAFGAALRTIRLLATEGDFADVSRWLRSPFFAAPNSPDQYQAAHLESLLRLDPGGHQGFAASWRKHGLRALFARHLPSKVPQIDTCLDRTPRRATPTAWTTVWQASLKLLQWQGTEASVDPELQAAWDRTWERFSGLTPILGRIDAGSAYEAFENIATSESVVARPSATGVQLLTRMEQVGPGFAAAWVAGCTEERMPPAIRPNPFIPWSIQLKHGMPGAHPRVELARARDAIERLEKRLPNLVFSCPQRVQDLPQTPSPLIRGWCERQATGLNARSQRGSAASTRIGARRWSESQAAAPPFTGSRIPGGTRTLNLQSACPAKAFCSARLHAEPLELPVRGVDARLRGILVHRVLELLLDPAVKAVDNGTGRIEGCIEQAIRELTTPGDARWNLQLDLERTRLQSLATRLLAEEAMRPPFSIIAVEKRTATQFGPWQIACRIDRIDCLPTGGTLLIDYKTGETVGDRWFEPRLADCQLPAYALTGKVAGIATIRLAGTRVEYRGAGLGSAVLRGHYRQFDDTEWSAQLDSWRAQIQNLLDEFVRGDTRIPYAAKDFVRSAGQHHAGGPYASLTRVGELK